VIESVIYAGLVCATFIGAETLISGPKPTEAIKKLKQPAWAPPFWVWVIIGLVYYAVCFFILFRLFEGFPLAMTGKLAFAGLLVLMAMNAGSNYFLVRRRIFRSAFVFMCAYLVVAAGLFWLLVKADPRSAAAFAVYTVYLPYATAWTYRVWKMNL
jgi:tryptophan-rich sensory protein